MEIILMLLTMLLLSYGLWRICAAALYHDRSTVGRQGLRQIQKARKEKQDLWDSPICKSLSDLLCRPSLTRAGAQTQPSCRNISLS